MTGEHASGTDRIAEVARRCCPDAEILVNVQGDEPELDPRQIDVLVETLFDHPETEMATLAAPIRSRAVLEDPSCTKVVCAEDGRALYFSRAAIPFCRDAGPEQIEELLATRVPLETAFGDLRLPPGIFAPIDRTAAVAFGTAGEIGAIAHVGSRGVNSGRDCGPLCGWHRHAGRLCSVRRPATPRRLKR